MSNLLMTGTMGKIVRPGMLILFFFPCKVFSQSPSVHTTIDKKEILIGERVKVKLVTLFPLPDDTTGYSLLLPDSIPHFELIDKGSAMPVNFKDNSKAIEQIITLTSFDSGQWNIPPFRINIGTPGASGNSLYTDSIPVNITYSPSDSTNRLRDIKPVIDVSVTDYFWYYIAAGSLVLLLVVFLLLRYLRKRKKYPIQASASRLSPYEEAMLELEKLGRSEIHQAEQIKLYHIRLSNIFRRYLGRKQDCDLQNKTTGDLLINMSANGFSMETITMLAVPLRCNDAVKFAKYLPPLTESDDCLVKLREAINLIEPLTRPTPSSGRAPTSNSKP